MNHEPQNSRRQAARNFVNALDELESVLKSEPLELDDEPPRDATRRQVNPQPNAQPTDLPEEADLDQLLGDAVQDIEAFMAADESSQPET